MTRALTLVERRSRSVRLPRAERDFLLAHARHLIDVSPTFERGTYRLTPRGMVGFLDGPTVRYTIRPKTDWPNLALLLGLAPVPATEGDPRAPAPDLLGVLAVAFADRLDAVARAGLVAGYGEVETASPFLRGKLRLADQMRDAASRAFPELFHQTAPSFDLNTPWNQIPQATATALLRCPLPLPARQRVEAAAGLLEGVCAVEPTDSLFALAVSEPRAVTYKPLLDVCRMILCGLRSFDPHAIEARAFLLDLGAAFERYLARELAQALVSRPAWRV
ncbi:MAG: McrC family protein, partial [Gemmataceae bacterium]|nr:McrC family protein [Gemmataceae bacterium]